MLGLSAALAAAAHAEERNVWPLWVAQVKDSATQENKTTPAVSGSAASSPASTVAPGSIESWTSAGPLLFSQPVIPSLAPSRTDRAVRVSGLRPFYVQKTDADGRVTDAYILPPFFEYNASDFGSRWKIFSLIQRETPAAVHVSGPTSKDPAAFDVWPFYFSRQTGNPETSYRALFPIYGSVPYRFGLDRWTWVGFPLYARFEKNGVTTTTAPWPFVKVMRGEGNRGFELWPLFGSREKAGEYREQFYLWPFFYKNEKKLSEPQPDISFGVLPFYTSTIDANSQSKTYLWPFFGWFDRTAPLRYHETHYFWPLFVQGRGEARYVNRWAPFYTHSIAKGVDKTWILWPLWRQRVSDEGPLIQTKQQVLYFVYNSTRQRSATNPAAAPAHKTHLWPLFTAWDNGAGRRQVQVFSPLEVFVPLNETIRVVYSPLFAVYRYDRSSPESSRHSLLWNFITWKRTPQEREFHLGPILGVEKYSGQKRVTLLAGVIGADRTAARGWRPFLFKFKRSAPAVASGVPTAAHP
ncbi:MAG: hypothetical protein QM760_06800 [Nibricoccus sp.]